MLLDLVDLKQKYDLKITGVIHVGAHYGQENHIYEKLGIQNRIFFEPLSSNFRILKENIDPKYEVINKALGNSNGSIEMYVEKNNSGQSSSILKPKHHLIQYPHIQFTEKEIVEMDKLDDYHLDDRGFNFINIDVQGYELEVFKGAKKTLEKIDYIISEVNRDDLYENCAKIWELEEFLLPFGFRVMEINWEGRTWGDAFFMKDSSQSNNIHHGTAQS
jgi:FkbM family methyltransferase